MQRKGKESTGAKFLDGDHLWLITVYTGTVDSSLVTDSMPMINRFGGSTFNAVVRKHILQIVNASAGDFTTVHGLHLSQSLVLQVFNSLQLINCIKTTLIRSEGHKLTKNCCYYRAACNANVV